MKRATSMLGALAMLAVGFLFAAPAAHAVTCASYPTTPIADTPASNLNSWPRTKEKNSNPAVSSIYNCYPNGSGGTLITTEFNALWQGAQSVSHWGTSQPPYYLANVYYQNKTRIYFYKNLNDLNTHWGTSYSPTGKFFGVTLRSGDTQNPNVPIGSVGIVREHTDGTVYGLNTIKTTAYHELGHVFDIINNSPSTLMQSYWTSAKNNDIYDLDDLPRAQAFPTNIVTIRSQCTSVYNESWDPSTHTGTSNWTVAQCQWPYYTLNDELFANVFAKRVGGSLGTSDNASLLEFSTWMGSKFWDETRTYMDSINWTGYNP